MGRKQKRGADARPGGEATPLARSLPEVPPPVEATMTSAAAADAADAAIHHEPDDQPVAGPDDTSQLGEPGPDGEGPAKQWANPYKATFTSTAGGFEVGEDRRFKQVVFQFKDKPDADVIEKLKGAGFKYRSAEKAWTVPASAATRELARNLATELYERAGGSEMFR